MRQFLLAVVTAGVAALAAVTAVAVLGLAPVGADVPPSGLERRVAQYVLRRSVARRAEQSAMQASTGDTDGGEEIYEDMCARCHGGADGKPSSLGSAFHPPAPRLSAHALDATRALRWSDAELFWLVKHGIRNTGMPAWGGLLSDDDIRRVVAYLLPISPSRAPSETRNTGVSHGLDLR